MKTFQMTAISLCALLAGAAAVHGAPRAPKATTVPAANTANAGLETAALRAVARQRIAEEVERRLVRPTDPATTERDARRIAAALSREQLRAIAAGGDVQAAIAPAMAAMRASAVGDATSDLLFVPLAPCRIIDTRQGGGILSAGETRNFVVTGVDRFETQGGNSGGCGVPAGSAQPVAAAVMINLVAVNVTGKGNLAAWAFGQPQPLASSINYQALDMNIANGLIVPINGTNMVNEDLSIKASFSAAHVVADVTGYFTRFPIEQFQNTQKTITVTADGGQIDLSAGTCMPVNQCTITANAAGKVIVRAWTQVRLNHGTQFGGDRIVLSVKAQEPTVCTNNESVNASDFEVSDSIPADATVDTTLAHERIFTQSKGTQTYYANAIMFQGADAGDQILSSRMVCTFLPN